MLKTYVVGGASDLVKQDLTSKLANFGLNVIGHLDYEKARGGNAKKTLPISTQVIVILSDMVNHSCSNNYVKEAKRRDIYHLILPRKTSFWSKIIEQLIPLNERKVEVVDELTKREEVEIKKPEVKELESRKIINEETWTAALKAIPEFITLIKTIKEISTVIEVVAKDHNVPNEELQRRWNEIAGKSVVAIRAVSKLPDVNSKVLFGMFGIPMATAAAYLAHASRMKKKAVQPQVVVQPSLQVQPPILQDKKVQSKWCSVHQHYKPCEHNGGMLSPNGYRWPTKKKPSVLLPSPLIGQPRPLPVLPPLPPPIPPSQRPIVSIETLTVSGKLRDIQHLQMILQALQKSGQISRGLLIQR